MKITRDGLEGNNDRTTCEHFVPSSLPCGDCARGTMTKEEAVAKLDTLSGDDSEAEHGLADAVLTDFLESNGYPEIAKAWNDACKRVGFWFG